MILLYRVLNANIVKMLVLDRAFAVKIVSKFGLNIVHGGGAHIKCDIKKIGRWRVPSVRNW